jgi:hypothetical protein
VARQERVRSASARRRRAPEQAQPSIPCPPRTAPEPCAPPSTAAACAEGHPHQCNASMITLTAVKTPGSSSALLATQGAHAHILDARGFAHLRDALICGRAQGSACLRRLPNGRPSVDHTSQLCTTSCRTVLRRRNAKNVRLLVCPAGVFTESVGQCGRAACSHRQMLQMPVPTVAVQPGILVQWV